MSRKFHCVLIPVEFDVRVTVVHVPFPSPLWKICLLNMPNMPNMPMPEVSFELDAPPPSAYISILGYDKSFEQFELDFYP